MRPCPIAFHDLVVGGLYEMADDGVGFKRGDLVEITDLTPGSQGMSSVIRARKIGGGGITVGGAGWFRAPGTAGIEREFVVDVEGFGHVSYGMRVQATSPEAAIALAYERCGVKAVIR